MIGVQVAAALHARAHAIDRLAALLLKHGDSGLTAWPCSTASASPTSVSSFYGDSERTLAALLLLQQQQQQQQKQQQTRRDLPAPSSSDGADVAANVPWQRRTRSAFLAALPPAAAHSHRLEVQQQQAEQPASKAYPLHCDVPDCKHCQYEARWRQVREVEGGERQVELLGLLLGGGRTASSRAALAAGGRRLAWGRDSNSR